MQDLVSLQRYGIFHLELGSKQRTKNISYGHGNYALMFNEVQTQRKLGIDINQMGIHTNKEVFRLTIHSIGLQQDKSYHTIEYIFAFNRYSQLKPNLQYTKIYQNKTDIELLIPGY